MTEEKFKKFIQNAEIRTLSENNNIFYIVKNKKCLFQIWFPTEDDAKVFLVRRRLSEESNIGFQDLNILVSCAYNLVYNKFQSEDKRVDIYFQDSIYAEAENKKKKTIVSMFKNNFITTVSKPGIDDIDFEKDFKYLSN